MTVSLVETDILGDPPQVIQYAPESDVSLTVSGGATPSEESEAIEVAGISELAVVFDHNRTGSDSTDIDLELYTSLDGVGWDTDPFWGQSLGASKRKTFPVTPPNTRYVKWVATNNDAVNATAVKPVVVVKR